MSPTLKTARLVSRYAELGKTADAIEWWRPGLLLADGVIRWEQVTGRKA